MVTLLAGWALSLNMKVRDVLVETTILKKRFSLYEKAKAGVYIAQKILIEDKKSNEVDSIQELWANEKEIEKYLFLLGYDKKELKLEITDSLSKIQINALVSYPNKKNGLQVKLWERFLDGLRFEYPELIKNPYDIINPLLDWLDFKDDDSITGITGAEKHYYESENKLLPRNGPMKSLEELSYVKGVTEKLWNKVYNSGIADKYFTVEGNVKRSGSSFEYEGKININTAPMPIIGALIEDHAFYHMAEEICSLREQKVENKYLYDLTGEWYKKCPGCEDIPFAEDLITTSSDIFEVKSTATDGDISVIINCVMRRETDKSGKWTVEVLKWRTQ